MKARTVCCGKVIDVDKGTIAHKGGEELLVCNKECKARMESARTEEVDKIKMELTRDRMNEIMRDARQQGSSARFEMTDIDREE
ncbi:hypothetical protein GF318_05195 [Candidatus Micrarchaeota archaeon]|nr:hypothetical protein [Candidatus Micrarchaeota archaeon]